MSLWEEGKAGRIPFRIRIGVAGHRDIDEDDPLLLAAVGEQIRGLVDEISDDSTLVQLAVVSQLADGADRVVVREVKAEARKRHHEGHLEVFLPMERRHYVAAQRFEEDSLTEFDELLGKATFQRELPGADTRTEQGRADAYAVSGRRVVARCDVLIALWDGKQSGGLGGTAETLLYAAARSKPCIWISTAGPPTVKHNLARDGAKEFYTEIAERAGLQGTISWSPMDHPDEALDPLRGAFGLVCRFNREKLNVDPRAVLRAELVSRREVPSWVGAPFVRATTLARRWQRRFQWTARAITLLAAAAAVMLAVGLSIDKESAGWAWAEAGFFSVALIGLLVVRRYTFHGRWLTYRVLAEQLRSAHFLAPTGADFRRQARLETVYAGKEPTGWVMRAFEEVWDRRPAKPKPLTDMGKDEFDRFKRWLAEDWIGEQIAYHEGAIASHGRWQRRLAGTVVLLFLATIAFACLHSLHVAEDAAVFFSIALPAAGASLGVMLTVNQHQALSERSARMRSDLAVVQCDVEDATAASLERAASEAARVIALETGAWFGSMWFLDIEHP
jgi:nucleoside 2-deoxyribosyltransferase